MIVRTPGLGKEMQGAALVCEPVHNLVARFEVESEGGSFVGKRFDEDKEFDFFTSTDPFCRPVRAVNAPDGTLWILDMSRQVIEHPEWIPTAWQERLNVRSGENLGRIYRVYHESFRPYPISTFGKGTSNLSAAQLLSGLTDENAAVRELALLYWIWNKPKADAQKIARINEAMHKTAQGHPNSAIRVTALGLLLATNEMTDADIASAFECEDPHVVRVAIELAEPQLQTSPELRKQFIALVKRNRGSQVDLQWLLTSLSLPPQETADSLATLAERSLTDRWIIRSLALCRDPFNANNFAEAFSLQPTRLKVYRINCSQKFSKH